MGTNKLSRLRGKSKRDRRQPVQAGMVGASVDISDSGEWQFQTLDAEAELLAKPTGSNSDLLAVVRTVVAQRVEPLVVPEHLRKVVSFQATGFNEDIRESDRIANAPHAATRELITFTKVGQTFRDPRGGVRVVVDVVSASTLRSRSAWWLWNPERAFRFLNSELFLDHERQYDKPPNRRWRDRMPARYVIGYMETM